jgi:hypothetical protein
MIHEPKNLTTEQKKRIVEVHRYKVNGGSISCGHDFWEFSKDKPFGDIFLCARCSQYFVKMSGLPWWNERRKSELFGEQSPQSDHMDGVWFHPIDIRCHDENGNDIVRR